MDFYHTLTIEHNRKTKKFQWRKSYSLRDFRALLSQVFNLNNNEILGLKDRTGNVFDLDFFCKNPQELKSQIYYLVLEKAVQPMASSKKTKDPFEKMSEPARHDFLFFLDKLVEDGFLGEEDYYFLKCMFFEQGSMVINFTRQALMEKNPYKFQALIKELLQATKHATATTKSAINFRSPQSFRLDNNYMGSPNPNFFEPMPKTEPSFDKTPVLRPKTAIPEKSAEVMQYICERMIEKLEISERELDILRTIIVVQKNEMILSSFEVFQSNKDEEDFVDTLKRILAKIRGGKQDKDPLGNTGKASYFVNQRPFSAVDEKRTEDFRARPQQVQRIEEIRRPNQEANMKIPEERPKMQGDRPKPNEPAQKIEETKQRVEQPKQNQRKSEETRPKTQPEPRNQADNKASTVNPKKNMLDLIFKTFFEETEEEFEPIEIGFAKHLYEQGDAALINILNTCETIPKAVVLVKELAVKAYTAWLNENFEEKQTDYVLKNRNERSSEICSIIHNFKGEGRLDHLKKVLHAVVMSKENLLSQNAQGNAQKTNKYSQVAVSRSKNKKTSFRMMLHREAQQQTVNIMTEDTDLPVIVTMSQEENADLRQMLNNFYEEESYDKNSRNVTLLEEALKAADYLTQEQRILLKRMLEEQNYDLLVVLSKFERLNKNPKKIKTDITKLLNTEWQSEELSGSPIIKKKKRKFNAFKQAINDIFEKYRLISQKQMKLFQYLYMEEDLTILGAFEVFLKTNELQDFIENLVIIDKYHYFKTRLDFDEIEQFDKKVETQLEILFMYKKYMTNDQRTNLEKIIRAGDDHLLVMYSEFKKNSRPNEDFLKQLVNLAEIKTKEIQDLEQKIKDNRKEERVEKKRLDTIDTFYQSKFLKKVLHMSLVTELVEENHKLIDAIFSIFEMNKDKAEFVENLTLVHNWAYKEKYRKLLVKLKETMNLKKNQVNFFFDCIEFDLPNIMAPYEIYMLNPDDPQSLEELRETIRIILNVYVKEILLLEKKYY